MHHKPFLAQGHMIRCGHTGLVHFVQRTDPLTFLLLGQAVHHLVLIAERVQSLTVCPYVQTHYWPDFCQRWLRASLPLWLERWAVCTECWTTQWKMSKLSLSNCWSFMGEIEVFHVGRTRKAKEGKKSVVRKFQSHLFNDFCSPLFLISNLKAGPRKTFACEVISKKDQHKGEEVRFGDCTSNMHIFSNACRWTNAHWGTSFVLQPYSIHFKIRN